MHIINSDFAYIVELWSKLWLLMFFDKLKNVTSGLIFEYWLNMSFSDNWGKRYLMFKITWAKYMLKGSVHCVCIK